MTEKEIIERREAEGRNGSFAGHAGLVGDAFAPAAGFSSDCHSILLFGQKCKNARPEARAFVMLTKFAHFTRRVNGSVCGLWASLGAILQSLV